MIASYLPQWQDRFRLSAVSSVFHSVLRPGLWRRFVVRGSGTAREPKFPRALDRQFRLSVIAPDFCSFIRHLELQTKFHPYNVGYCYHSFQAVPHHAFSGRNYWSRLAPTLRHYLFPLIESIPQDQLLTFRFELGVCPPEELLTTDSTLARRQTKLKSLSLATARVCLPTSDQMPDIDSTWTALIRLSWRAVIRYKDFRSIGMAVWVNRAHLEELTIETGATHAGALAVFEHTPLSEGLDLRTLLWETDGSLQRLRSLSLAGLRIDPWNPINWVLTKGVDINTLNHLSIINCEIVFPMDSSFFKDRPLPLKRLEWVSTPGPYVERILSNAATLERCYLAIDPTEDQSPFIARMQQRACTLRRLVLHRGMTGPYGIRNPPYQDSFSCSLIHRLYPDLVGVECMGLCIGIAQLIGLFAGPRHGWLARPTRLVPNEGRPSWKILHLRVTQGQSS